MNKTQKATALLLPIAFSAFAQPTKVNLTVNRSAHSSSLRVDRAPMRAPIDVIYDDADSSVKVIAAEDLMAETFVLNTAGEIVAYSATTNTTIYIPKTSTADEYTIIVESDNWIASGIITQGAY